MSRLPRDGSVPLLTSHAEEALWFADRWRKGTNAFNDTTAFQLAGADAAALEAALVRLVERHEILRTSFHEVDGQLRRRIHGVEAFRVLRQEIAGSDAAARQQQALAAQHEKCFELDAGPLFRASILEVAGRARCLGITMHHIICDFPSWKSLRSDLAALYDAVAGGCDPKLPQLEFQYADYAGWQRQRWSGAKLDALRNYWVRQLQHAPDCINLPTDRPRTGGSGPGGCVIFKLSRSVHEEVEALARQQRTSTFVILLATFSLLLHRVSGDSAVVVGVPLQSRARMELPDMVGLFLDTIALQTLFADVRAFDELFAQVNAATIEGRARAEMPTAALLDGLGRSCESLHTPVFQVMFNFRGSEFWKGLVRGGVQQGGLASVGVSPVENSLDDLGSLVPIRIHAAWTAKYDLLMNVAEDEELTFYLTYNAALFERETINGMANQYTALLKQALVDACGSVDADG